jgi:hypothetical protein
MIDRLIIIAKNRDFPRIGDRLPATVSGVSGVGKGSSAPSRQELPSHSGTPPASAPSAELMET